MRQIVMYPDRQDGGWVAEVPSLPGCISQGETREETIANVKDAIDVWLEGAESVGLQVPPESFDVQVFIV